MKRFIPLLLALMLLLAPLAACGAQDADMSAGAPGGQTQAAAPSAEGDGQAEHDVSPEDWAGEALGPAVTGSEALPQGKPPDEDGRYSSRDEVALYLVEYGRLPDNFITKKEAKALGWEGGPLEPFAPGCSIGGDRFGNYEGALPEGDGRRYTECDIDTAGAEKRGAKRLVFSDDGLIFYTEDHYETFTLLTWEE